MKIDLTKIKEKFDQKATLENLAYLIIFFLPVYLIKVDFFGLSTNLLEILIVIFLILFLFDKGSRTKAEAFSRGNKKYLMGFAIIITGLLITTFTNNNIVRSLGIIKGWFLLPFFFSLAVVSLIEKEKRIRIFKVYFFSAIFLAIIGLKFLFSGQLTFDQRLKGIFNSPNYLAMYLAPALIIGFFVFKKEYKLKYFFWAVLLITLFFTYSYLSWMAIFGTAIGIGFGAQKRPSKKVFPVIMIVVAIFLILTLRTEKMKDLLNFSARSSVASRVMIWQSAKKILTENWLLGIGPSNFQTQYLAQQKYYPPYLEWAVPHPHSLYLAFWLYGGILGIGAFFGMLFWWLKEFIENKKRETALGLVSLGIILYFLFHGLADTTYFKNDLAVVFWLAFLSLL